MQYPPSQQYKLQSNSAQSTSVSPYEYIAAQMRIQEQRYDKPINQFVLQDNKYTGSNHPKEEFFVIEEQEQEGSKIELEQANYPFSTIRNPHQLQHNDPENSDILIKQWLEYSQPKPYIHLMQNNREQFHRLQNHYMFDTMKGYIAKIDPLGKISQMQIKPTGNICRRGILLVGKGRKKRM